MSYGDVILYESVTILQHRVCSIRLKGPQMLRLRSALKFKSIITLINLGYYLFISPSTKISFANYRPLLAQEKPLGNFFIVFNGYVTEAGIARSQASSFYVAFCMKHNNTKQS